jgi:hypothetical protein
MMHRISQGSIPAQRILDLQAWPPGTVKCPDEPEYLFAF